MITRRRVFKTNTWVNPLPNTMYIEVLEDGLQFSKTENPMYYSIDAGQTWTFLDFNTTSPEFSEGTIIHIYSTSSSTGGINGIGTFTITKKCNIGGNVMSLIGGLETNIVTISTAYTFARLFQNCTNIIKVSKNFLPATTLAIRCYSMMFYGCISLIEAPDLPALTLKTYCYGNMFEGCTSLEKAPVLPAISFNGTYCYYYMFRNCEKLNYVKALFKTLPSTSYTTNWLSGVSSTGTFVKASDATWTQTGVSGVPTGWTVITE